MDPDTLTGDASEESPVDGPPARPSLRQWLADAPVPAGVRRLFPQRVKVALRGAPIEPEPEPESEPPPAPGSVIDERAELADGLVDVAELLRTLTVERLAEAADDYYTSNLDDHGYYSKKPFTSVDETPDYLIAFAQLVAGLRPLPGMRVLDFGAGTGWATRILTQMGCAVTSVDVSKTALGLGEQLLDTLPVVGDHHPPEFLRFDGHRLPLDDASVDRVFCFDAFHHVPNPAEVLAEIGRVLRDGGIAGFNEPGPNHSLTPQSQFEMRNFTVVENDILMHDIRDWAEAAGLTRLELCLFDTRPHLVDFDMFDAFLRGDPDALRAYTDRMRQFLCWRRLFFLSKGDAVVGDSRGREGLAGELTAVLDTTEVTGGGPLVGELVARNTGTVRWLPSSSTAGAVKVGAHLYEVGGRLLDRDFGRIPLPGDGVDPGGEVTTRFELRAPEPGSYVVELDLLSEGVCWFEINGTRPVQLAVEVT